ncbi:hypothetical protein SSTU70S_05199 [Stutzerimonas stutzeri]
MPLLLGSTWRECLANIALLSVPAFIAAFWPAPRGLAPTRPHLAGGAAGLLAGSVAALAYSLHCPEMAVPFWALWHPARHVAARRARRPARAAPAALVRRAVRPRLPA